MTAEEKRLAEARERTAHWKRWGPYLTERQWGTVREDYSPYGNAWEYLPHDHARSRVYRWGEDGLFGISDNHQRLCFGLALWNEKDPILKERLFGLTGNQGNHGEDVKEYYFYLDSTPTHSYMKGLYKYPQVAYPYAWLVEENGRRGRRDSEFELLDTGVFNDNRYFDVFVEYAKADTDDILIRITAWNRGPEAAPIHMLPTLWFRNTWSWDHGTKRPNLSRGRSAGRTAVVAAEHPELPGNYRLYCDGDPELLFTENETNQERLFAVPNPTPYVKDAFHRYVIAGESGAVNPRRTGTKAAAHYALEIPARGQVTLRLRLSAEGEAPAQPFGPGFDETCAAREREARAFYDEVLPEGLSAAERATALQGYAGLLQSKQFFHYVMKDWLEGDPAQPAPPPERRQGRNREWLHLYNRDVISMPDKWEYPWYAAWDLAFHMIPFAKVDPHFAKQQLLLFLREWYLHPSGQIPAYEWAFSDVNPPVHAWAAWRVYKIEAPPGKRDREFLRRVFDKLVMNFTWWVNRKDPEGQNLFAGGFLGLDNIGVFDRSQPLPTGGHLEQADGTAWMAFYCATMLAMALELAKQDPVYEDMASKFFEHFVAIVDAMNALGGTGLWDEGDGFYYDQLHANGTRVPLRTRSLVGLIPLLAVEVLEDETLDALPAFRRRMEWFLRNRGDLAAHVALCACDGHGHKLLSVPSEQRLVRVLRYLLDEAEFLSPHGVRALSAVHRDRPFEVDLGGMPFRVDYAPGESTTGLFGGNSNWRGPIWFPVNYLVIEALRRFARFFGDDYLVEHPTGSGRMVTLQAVADDLGRRLVGLFLRDPATARRPVFGDVALFQHDPAWRDLIPFHEYFHGDTGRGIGASHQTGWTGLVADLIVARSTA
jgi:hypothetical protein